MNLHQFWHLASSYEGRCVDTLLRIPFRKRLADQLGEAWLAESHQLLVLPEPLQARWGLFSSCYQAVTKRIRQWGESPAISAQCGITKEQSLCKGCLPGLAQSNTRWAYWSDGSLPRNLVSSLSLLKYYPPPRPCKDFRANSFLTFASQSAKLCFLIHLKCPRVSSTQLKLPHFKD